MRYYYKVYMKRTMEWNNEHRKKGTQKLKKVTKEKTAPPMRPKSLKIRSRKSKREKLTTWKDNLIKLNSLVLMGNQRPRMKQKLGCCTLKIISEFTIILAT